MFWQRFARRAGADRRLSTLYAMGAAPASALRTDPAARLLVGSFAPCFLSDISYASHVLFCTKQKGKACTQPVHARIPSSV